MNVRGKYTVSAELITVNDATQFLQMLGTTGAIAEILEIRVFQTVLTTLDQMNAIHLERGTGGAGGTPRTEDEWGIDGPAAVLAVSDTAPTTEVTGVDLNYRIGWNFLQELVWLPTPEMWLPMKQNDDLALSLVVADVMTSGVGYTITWREYDV